jgi:hypothetical protein
MRLAGTSLCQHCQLPDKISSASNSPYKASVLRRTAGQFYQTSEKLFLPRWGKGKGQLSLPFPSILLFQMIYMIKTKLSCLLFSSA